MIERVAEALVAEVRGVENHAETIHLAHQLAPARAEVALGVGALRVDARAVVARPHGAQPIAVRAFEVTDGDERIGALEAEEVADRPFCRIAGGPLQVLIETGGVPYLHELAALFHRAVPRQLRLRHRPRLLGRVPARKRMLARRVAGDLRRHAEADLAAPHLRERHRPLARSGRSVCPCSRARMSSMGRVRSRFHSMAFIARSRWASTISISRNLLSPRVRDHDGRGAQSLSPPRSPRPPSKNHKNISAASADSAVKSSWTRMIPLR